MNESRRSAALFNAERRKMRPRDWLKLVDFDIRAAKMFTDEAIADDDRLGIEHRRIYVYFHAQQAIEKAMKGLLEGKITVPETHDIGILLNLCEENGINGLPKLSTATLNVITAWEETYDLKKEDEVTYRQAMELQNILHRQLKEVVEMSETAVDRLADKINHEYAVMREKWWVMTADELIENAEKIAAVKFVMANASDCVLDDVSEYLLGFKNPLEILAESIMYRYDLRNIAARETFSDIAYELYDKCDLDADYETEDSKEAEGMTMQ